MGLWDIARSGEIVSLKAGDRQEDYVESVAFSPDGRLLVSGTYDGEVRLWQVPGVQ